MSKKKNIQTEASIKNKGKKKFKQTNLNSEKRTVQANNPENYYKMKACWRFHRCHSDIKWPISKDNWSIWEDKILPKLIDLQSSTWEEIVSATKGHGDGSKSHNVSLEGCTKEARQELTRLNIYNDQVFSLRLSGKERIIGFLDMGVLEILCYTPEHEFVMTNKKHT